MIRFTPAIIIGFLLALLTGVGTASAQGSCRSTVDCLADQVCQPGLFGGQCVRLACNFNSDCPAARHLCFFGICQAGCFSSFDCPGGAACIGATALPGQCAPPPGPATPRPSGLPGEGAACGRVTFGGGVVKNIGCRAGLRCVFGRCQRLQP